MKLTKKKINIKDVIKYKCQKKDCDEINEKCIEVLIKKDCFCKNCTKGCRNNWNNIILEKIKDINDVISINDIPFDKVDKNKINNKHIIKFKCQNENCNEIHTKWIMNIKKYEFLCEKCSKIESKIKLKETNERLNKEYPNRQNEINNTRQKTNKDTYGVPYPCQNSEIFSKILKKSFSTKDYTLPSGTIIQIQGDEPYALDELFEEGYKEDNIVTQYEGIEYEFENSIHIYRADIYIKSENKIIEVKSNWTYDLDKEKNLAKQKGCLEQGFKFEFWKYDNKKNKEIL